MFRPLIAVALSLALASPALAQTGGPKDTGSMAYPDVTAKPIQAAPPANDTGSMATPGHGGAPAKVTATPPANDTGSMKLQDNGTAKTK